MGRQNTQVLYFLGPSCLAADVGDIYNDEKKDRGAMNLQV